MKKNQEVISLIIQKKGDCDGISCRDCPLNLPGLPDCYDEGTTLAEALAWRYGHPIKPIKRRARVRPPQLPQWGRK